MFVDAFAKTDLAIPVVPHAKRHQRANCEEQHCWLVTRVTGHHRPGEPYWVIYGRCDRCGVEGRSIRLAKHTFVALNQYKLYTLLAPHDLVDAYEGNPDENLASVPVPARRVRDAADRPAGVRSPVGRDPGYPRGRSRTLRGQARWP